MDDRAFCLPLERTHAKRSLVMISPRARARHSPVDDDSMARSSEKVSLERMRSITTLKSNACQTAGDRFLTGMRTGNTEAL